ncbi:DUF3052 domain-containing protein [Rothia aerolata]|uniref:DUF3052 domain-containing protein n=1 Tax=Rothia aerolata TaxID=1812262 RepID=A0A917MSU3_9MICC|nr:DUF3052 domain-containing protein [Rothia aerolata]GGH58526.1 hypothetical protein GCM10007359_04820 [Rothia aerolata]
MSETKTAADQAAVQFGFKDGDLIQEFGYDDDVDFDLRDSLEALVGSELLDEDDQEVVDAVLLWWREEDGDLIDGLMDVLGSLDEGGVIWLLTPKSGREGYVSPLDIQEAAPVAGLHVTTTETAGPEWAATRLVTKQVR